MKQQKKCRKCGKNLAFWNKSNLCSYHYLKEYRNSERGKEKRKKWFENNPEKKKIYNKSYYSRNKEKIKKQRREYYRKNPEKFKKWQKKYRQKVKENVTPKQ